MSDESDSGDERDDRYRHQDEKRRGLPKYGRDPQTSAGTTSARAQSWNNFANDKGRSHLIDSKPVGTCEKGSDHPEDEVRKKINHTLKTSPLSNLPPQTSPKRSQLLMCPRLKEGPLQTLLTPPSEPSPPRLGRTIELPVPNNVPTMEEVMDVNVPPLGQRSPGLLAAAHFEKLMDPTLGRAEDSFFAFGAIIVGGGVEQPPYVYQGAAYIHLYGPELDASSNRPTPPPLRRVLDTYEDLFPSRYHLGPDPVPTLDIPRNTPFPDQSVARPSGKVNPPPYGPQKTTVTDGRGRPISMADAIVRLRRIEEEMDSEDSADADTGSMDLEDSDSDDISTSDESYGPLLRRPGTPNPWKGRSRSVPKIAVLDDEMTDRVPPIANNQPKSDESPRMGFTHVDTPFDSLDGLHLCPGSPIILNYPDDFEEDDELTDDAPTNSPLAKDKKVLAESDREDVSKKEALDRIHQSFARLEPYLDILLEHGDQSDVQDFFAKLGLLQIAHDIGAQRLQGIEPDRDYWVKKITAVLEERSTVDTGEVATDLLQLREAWQRGRSFGQEEEKKRQDEEKKPEVKKEAVDESGATPYKTHDWLSDVKHHFQDHDENMKQDEEFYVPKSPVPGNRPPYLLPMPHDPEEFRELRKQVSDLEEDFGSTLDGLRAKVKRMDDQIMEDGCLLTNLRWKFNETRRCEARERECQEVAYNMDDPRGLRRFHARTVIDERLAGARMDLTRLNGEIKVVERRIEATHIDAESIKARLDKMVTLAPDLEGLAKTVEDNHQAYDRELKSLRDDVDSALLILATRDNDSDIAELKQDMATFKKFYGPKTQFALEEHGRNIATLMSCFQYLYQLVYSAYAAGARQENQACATEASSPPHVDPEAKAVEAL
ncbi:hypothetical protein BJ322DRAFT_1021774 [Thelephora terrestris]|uniref:Uncharacterized protein n=1 Tax=Thelephora terrestris TaxID=56493 RepID=A0A9P6HC40_9AGAM|nr:hypothetical protein BJ322DRAFT_1021774 [Thelephora terrestris]